jgi:anti-sigma-K factor RskA
MAHFAGELALGAAAAPAVAEVGADGADVVVAVAVDDAAGGDVELYMETGVVVDGEEWVVTDSSRPVRASYCFVRDHKNIAS